MLLIKYILMKLIAIQGILGSFHHEAALKFFKNKHLRFVECSNFKQVCKSVEKEQSHFGVLAIENSIAGSLLPNFSLLEKYNLNIIGEVYLQVNMNLMALPGQKLEDLHTIQSHAVAILQSENFLSQHKNCVFVDKFDTATCAREIYQKRLFGVGAIASKFVAEMYDLEILAWDIQNHSKSFTRFYILSRKELKNSNFNKVSLYFTLKHKSGRLVSLLNNMARLNLNMTKIQSIPLQGNPFEYSFYVDILVDNHENYYQLINQLNNVSSHLKILGEYREDDFFKKELL